MEDPFDPNVIQKNNIATFKRQADAANEDLKKKYRIASADYLSSYGKAPYPVRPLKKVIDDSGNESFVFFTEEELPSPAVLPTGPAISSSPRADVPDPIMEKLKVIEAKLDYLYFKLVPKS